MHKMKTLHLLVVVLSVYCGESIAKTVNFDALKLGDSDASWEKVQIASSRSLTTPSATTNLNSPLESTNTDGEFASQNSLKEFLESYAEKLRKDKLPNDLNHEDGLENESDKDKKSWNLLDVKRNKYSTDERKGWVTLDPIPWSVSKVSRWKPKPIENTWDAYSSNQHQKPWENDFASQHLPPSQYQYIKKPESNQDDYKVYYISEKNPVIKQPFTRPFTVYDQTIHSNHHKTPIRISGLYDPLETLTQHRDGIIVDKSPPNFPTENYDSNRRTGIEDKQPQAHPFLGEGEWVLLSTTKGYKSPRSGQRSLDFKPQSLTTRKSVQLTVLPPLKNSKINMTTSHGGLLQVESTFESVEQAQKKYKKQQKIKIKKKKRPNSQVKRKKKVVKEIADSTIATVPRSVDRSAVLAAVGAGMIPATMAMLVPMVNGRKRRRKREALTTNDPNMSVEITLPRYY